MKQSNTSRYAYLAGLIDGEGCISIKSRESRYGKSKQYELFIQISQKDGKMIDWLYGNFGGVVDKKFFNTGISKGSSIYSWRIQNRKAFDICKRVLPFLIVKKKQAEIGIRFGHRIRQRNGRDELGRNTRLTEEELQKREELKQLLHRQKKIYIESAVVETKRGESSNDDKQ